MIAKEYKQGKYTIREHSNGDKLWCFDKKLHREDGPAIELINGYKAWYVNGKRHREDGPAIIQTTEFEHWFLNGNRIHNFSCKFVYDNWVEIKELNYIGPYRKYSKCFIELPFKISGHKFVVNEH